MLNIIASHHAPADVPAEHRASSAFTITHGPNSAVYSRTISGRTAVVCRVGTTAFASWGFTLWSADTCVGGVKNARWLLEDACAAASRSLVALVDAGDGLGMASSF